MNDREIAEIRRRLRPEKNNIGHIRGCYVNENKSIISEFNQMLGLISTDESEEILSHLRKILSGSIGRNIIDISFSNTALRWQISPCSPVRWLPDRLCKFS